MSITSAQKRTEPFKADNHITKGQDLMMSIQNTGKLIRQHLLRALIFAPVILGALAIASEAAPIGNVQNVQWNAANTWYDVSFTVGTTAARIVFYRDDIFRIWVSPTSTFANGAQADVVVYDTKMQPSPGISDSNTYFKIESKECVLRIYKSPCRFALYRKDNITLVFEEQSPIDITATNTTQTLKYQTNEFFYGCGGWNGNFTLNGKVAKAYYQAIDQTGASYNENGNPNPSPYYCSLKGYGAYRNTWQPGTYTMKNPVLLQHNENRFDCYYFYGPSMEKVLDGYTILTGRPFMPPIWGLDFGIQGEYDDGYHGTMQECTDEFAKYDFPTGWNMPNDMWRATYPPVQALVPIYKEKNMWTNLWCGKFMEDSTLRIMFVRDWGIRFFKMDCEWIGDGYQHCYHAMKTMGPNGLEKFSPDSARTFLQFTGGWAGQQRFGFPWTGDNGMSSGNWTRWHIPTLTGGAMSALNGICVEMASIFGVKDEKLFLRAVQWQMMEPFVFINGFWMDGNLPKYPWVQITTPALLNVCRKSFKLHTRLVPYFYTLCYEAWKTGVSSQRPCLLEFPDDPNTWGEGTTEDTKTKQEFMLGPWFLFRPVFENLTNTDKVTMYLPGTSNTRWIDYWTGSTSTGGQNIQAYAGGFSISGANIVMPTYILEGAIIPMFPEQYYTGTAIQRPREPLTLDVYPHRSQKSSFSYYEDDGLTREFKRGRCGTTLLESDATKWVSGKSLVVTIGQEVGDFTGKPVTKTYMASIHTGILDKNKPASVFVDKAEVPEKSSMALLNAAANGWFYDNTDRGGILWVKTGALTASDVHYISTGAAVNVRSNITHTTLLDKFYISSAHNGKVGLTFANMFSGEITASISDIQGRVVSKKVLKVVHGSAPLCDRSDLTSGQYILDLNYNGKHVSKKFVSQK